jgi:phosphoribosyl-AMP cyclohydrolase
MDVTDNWLDEVRWDEHGLVPAIAQDADSGRVLTLAWMSRDALAATVAEGRAVYWSRSRARLWRKGEESGHVQTLVEVRLDCDGDAVLLRVRQRRGIACHTGRASCFFRRLDRGAWHATDPVLEDPSILYGGVRHDDG